MGTDSPINLTRAVACVSVPSVSREARSLVKNIIKLMHVVAVILVGNITTVYDGSQ